MSRARMFRHSKIAKKAGKKALKMAKKGMNQSGSIYSLKHPLVKQIMTMGNFAFSGVSDNLRSDSRLLYREKDRSASTLDIGANRKSGMSAVFNGNPDESPSPWSTDKMLLSTPRPL